MNKTWLEREEGEETHISPLPDAAIDSPFCEVSMPHSLYTQSEKGQVSTSVAAAQLAQSHPRQQVNDLPQKRSLTHINLNRANEMRAKWNLL
ncbi:hypothetical protein Ciccas_004788 [Cichlidogyrus casuarinus]|uniref:Uncharacterized protein n=1 Tax=Cichlidogyrus casuarinus TaxID=1844966 RepID=A0ABD2QAI0_9PLAT